MAYCSRRTAIVAAAALLAFGSLATSFLAQAAGNSTIKSQPGALGAIDGGRTIYADAARQPCFNRNVKATVTVLQEVIDELEAFQNLPQSGFRNDARDKRRSQIDTGLAELKQDLQLLLASKKPCTETTSVPATPDPGGGIQPPAPGTETPPTTEAGQPPVENPPPQTPTPEERLRKDKEDQDQYLERRKTGRRLLIENPEKYVSTENRDELQNTLKRRIDTLIEIIDQIADLPETITNGSKVMYRGKFYELLNQIARFEELSQTASNGDQVEELERLRVEIETKIIELVTDDDMFSEKVVEEKDANGSVIRTTKTKTWLDGHTETTVVDKDGEQTVQSTNPDGTSKGSYHVTYKDGGVYVEWKIPSGSQEANWYPPGTEIKTNIGTDDPKPFIAIPPKSDAPPQSDQPQELKTQQSSIPALEKPNFAKAAPGAVPSDSVPVRNDDGSTSTTTTIRGATSTKTITKTTYNDGKTKTETVEKFDGGATHTQVVNPDGSSTDTNESTENGVTTTSTISTDKDKNKTTGKSTTMVGSPEKESSSTTMSPDGKMIHQTTSKTDKDGNTTVTETDENGKQTITATSPNGGRKATYRITEKDGGAFVEWDLPSGTGGGGWYPPGTEITPNLDPDNPLPFKAVPPTKKAEETPTTTEEKPPGDDVTSQRIAPPAGLLASRALEPAEEQADRTARAVYLGRAVAAIAIQRTIDLQAGKDVEKSSVVIIDRTTQQEIPTGKIVLIPQDPKTPMPPPVRMTDGHGRIPPIEDKPPATTRVDTPKTGGPPTADGPPPTQPGDTLVVMGDCHEKIVVRRSALGDGGKIALAQAALRMNVRGASCAAVTDAIVDRGLADQYGARQASAGSWKGADLSLGAARSCVVSVANYALLPGTSANCERNETPPSPDKPLKPSPGNPKDGKTLLDGGLIIEGDQPRAPQGPAPTARFAVSAGSWGQSYGDQWWLKSIGWLKSDGTTVLPERATPVTVAVIDTGVDFTHPQLAGANWINPNPLPRGDVAGWNFIDDNAAIRDLLGHGTAIAGIIAASGGNGAIAGINPWARIMALKALDLDGAGGSVRVAQAIGYAVDHGARVINLSLGGRTPTQNEQDALDYAASKGVLVVAASGNLGIDTARFSPSGLRNVLVVAAIGPDGKRPLFSNWGQTVAIAAPGVDILTLRARQTDLLQMMRKDYRPATAIVANDYYRVTGSSFSAPMVAGAASLLMSVNPALTAEQVRRMLMQSASDIEGIGQSQFSGYGLLNVAAALAANPNAFVDAAIASASVVSSGGKQAVRVTGTANADAIGDAHLDVGQGEAPTTWKKVGTSLKKGVVNGTLGDLSPATFAGGNVWTIRIVVTSKGGQKRQARFVLRTG